MKRLPLVLLSVFLVALVAAGALWRLGDLRLQSAAPVPTPASASPQAENFDGTFSLTDQDGQRRTNADFRGKYMLVFFGYTFCPDVCPTTLAIEAEALEKLGERANRIVPIFVTVDPKRDTSEKLKAYLTAFDGEPPSVRPHFVGLTGTEDEIAQAADHYTVYYRAHLDGLHGNGGDYSIDHTGNVYLMDPEGKFVVYYSQGILPDELAADLMKRTSG